MRDKLKALCLSDTTYLPRSKYLPFLVDDWAITDTASSHASDFSCPGQSVTKEDIERNYVFAVASHRHTQNGPINFSHL
jgi:hypothetical protein